MKKLVCKLVYTVNYVFIKCLAGLIDGGNMEPSLTKNESFLPQPTEQKVSPVKQNGNQLVGIAIKGVSLK